MLKIAVYGKGGIGKSTTVSNLASTLALQGHTVMQIGCDPKADSTYALMHGKRIPSVLELMRKTKPFELSDVVYRGFAGVLCVEAGGPTPGTGCAGRGIIAAFEQLSTLHAYEKFAPDIILYDVLGDVVCGGFSLPLRSEYSDVVYIVTSGEMMSLYAASNIASVLDRSKMRRYASLGGLILNRRKVDNERMLVEQAASELGTFIVADLPRSPDIQKCEQNKCTVVEGAPESTMINAYKQLAKSVLDKTGKTN